MYVPLKLKPEVNGTRWTHLSSQLSRCNATYVEMNNAQTQRSSHALSWTQSASPSQQVGVSTTTSPDTLRTEWHLYSTNKFFWLFWLDSQWHWVIRFPCWEWTKTVRRCWPASLQSTPRLNGLWIRALRKQLSISCAACPIPATSQH